MNTTATPADTGNRELRELQLSLIYENVDDVIFLLDVLPDGYRFASVNGRFQQATGIATDQVLGRRVEEIIPQPSLDKVLQHYAEAIRSGRRVCWEEASIYPAGTRYGEVTVAPMFDSNGHCVQLLGTVHDVTARKRAEQMDNGQREILAAIVNQKPLAEILASLALLYEELNPGALCSVLLMDADGEHILHGAAPSLPAEFNAVIHGQKIGPGRGSCGTAAWSRRQVIVPDIAGDEKWDGFKDIALLYQLRACWSTPVLDHSGRVLGTFAVYHREIREPTAEELESIAKLLSTAAIAIEGASLVERMRERDCFFDMATDVYCIFNPGTGRIVQVNPTFCRITGFDVATLTSRHFLEFIHPEDLPRVGEQVEVLAGTGRVERFAYRFLCSDGSYRWLEWNSAMATDGLAYAVARDITQQRHAETELTHAVNHDAITDLPHHLVLERVLVDMLEAASAPVWVLFIGLDRFQAINESLGHVIGDQVLRGMARRLRDVLGAGGQIARFAGDEFIIVADSLQRPGAIALADRLREAVARPITIGDYRLLLTASIGMSHSPDHGRNSQDLLRRAEAAMNQAKRQGRDATCEFSSEQMREIDDRLILGGHLRGAIGRDELELHYQPMYDAANRRLAGFEALLRWNNRDLGPVSPGRFIPIAEALGLMPEIGEWVVNEACRQAREWFDQGHRDFDIAVNVAAPQLQRAGLVAQVRDSLQRHGLAASYLRIELTESALMENVSRVRKILDELRELGTRLSLDDFGTGYSSLAYLKQFPIDKLKIDQSFVRGLPEDNDDAAIARTIVAMAHQLRMVVSAEGVETEAQARFLRGIGCDELQGYLLGRPKTAAESLALFSPAQTAERKTP